MQAAIVVSTERCKYAREQLLLEYHARSSGIATKYSYNDGGNNRNDNVKLLDRNTKRLFPENKSTVKRQNP